MNIQELADSKFEKRVNELRRLINPNEHKQIETQVASQICQADLDLVVKSLAARLAPCCDVDSSELPLRTYQLGHDGVPLKTDYPTDAYLKWLIKPLGSSGLTRLHEFAFVRACEKRCPTENNTDCFEKFERYFRPYVEEVLVMTLTENGLTFKKAAGLAVDATNKSLEEFHRSYLISNEELEKLKDVKPELRDRFAGIASVRKFLGLIAQRRLPRLAFVMTDEVLRKFLTDLETGNRNSDGLHQLSGKAWRTKAAFTNAVKRETSEEFATDFGEKLFKRLKRVEFDEVDKHHAASNHNNHAGIAWYIRKPVQKDPKESTLRDLLLKDELPKTGLDVLKDLRILWDLEKDIDPIDLPKELQHQLSLTILSSKHWEGCSCPEFRKNPLSAVEIARFTQFLFVKKKVEVDVEVSRMNSHQSIQRAFRKLHCCFATLLGDHFLLPAREKLSEHCDSRDLPTSSLLRLVLGLEITTKVCSSSKIGTKYHVEGKQIGEISKQCTDDSSYQKAVLGLGGNPDKKKGKRNGNVGANAVRELLIRHWIEISNAVKEELKKDG